MMLHSCNGLTLCIILFGTILQGTSGQSAPHFIQEPSNIIVQKNKPAVLNCTVSGNPKPTVSWRRNDRMLLLQNDKRRKILPDGSLYFTNIIHSKNDRPDEGSYQCVAYSSIRSRDYKVISRRAKLQVAGLSSKITIEPSPLKVIYGGIARLYCKVRHSVPKPQFQWKFKHKNGTVILLSTSAKYTLLDNGALHVRDAKFKDEGEYMCIANNALAMRSHSSGFANLTVEPDKGSRQKLEFIAQPPSDMTCTRGERLVLECIAKGSPKPVIQWYRDRHFGNTKNPIVYDDRVKLLGDGNLEITRVESADAGNYTCQASSSVFKDVALKVFSPPIFTTKPKDRNVHIDNNVVFKCSADGVPTPTITWMMNDHVVQESDYVTITDKNITISYLLSSDAGIYQCVAKNDLGEIQVSVELAVFEQGIPLPGQKTTTSLPATTTSHPTTTAPTTPTTVPPTIPETTSPLRFPSKPQYVQTRTISDTEIEVSWRPPLKTYGKIVSYNVFYLYNEEGKGITDMVNTTGDQLSVVFRKLKPNSKFIFRVFAKNQHGTGDISSSTVGTTASSGAVPGKPLSLVAVAMSSSQIRVQWAAPTKGTTATEYVLEYEEVGLLNAPKISTVLKQKQKTLKKLKTYTQYSISVYAVDSNNVKSAPATTFAVTLGGVPKGPPTDLVVRGDGSGSGLVVTWKPPHYSLANGRITKYLLEYRKKGRKHIKSLEIQGALVKRVLKKLHRNGVYEVRIAAGTSSGFGDYTQWVRGNTSVTKCSESNNPGRPTQLRVSIPVKGVEILQVEWQPPADVSESCVTGYVLEYGEGTPFSTKIPLNSTITKYLIKGINAGSKYVVKVMAINSKNDNGPSVLKDIHIPSNGDKKKSVREIRVTPVSSRELRVTWVDSDRKSNLYHVYRAFKNAVVYCGNTTKKMIDCSGLAPYTYYTVLVRRHGENINGTGRNRTKEEKPSPPLDFTGSPTEDNSTDLFLYWQIPEKVNGKILGYRVFYTANLSHPLDEWMKQDCNGSSMYTRVRDLTPGTEYYFKMQVQNGAGWSDLSETKMVKTPGDGMPTGVPRDSSAQGSPYLKDKTLWIVIAAVAGVTLIAIIIISVVLCKKRSGEDQR